MTELRVVLADVGEDQVTWIGPDLARDDGLSDINLERR